MAALIVERRERLTAPGLIRREPDLAEISSFRSHRQRPGAARMKDDDTATRAQVADCREPQAGSPETSDGAFRRRLIGVGHLLSGNGITALLALVGVAITARSLGPADYGVLALIVSYVRVFDRLMRFESWQPLIKYAAEADHLPDGRIERLRALFAFGLWLDVSACVAATFTAVLVAWLLAPLLGIGSAHIGLVIVNCGTLLLNISGMPTAALRLAGRFRTIAYVQVTSSIVRILLCVIGLWSGGGLMFFVIAWTLSQIISSLLFLGFALLVLRKQGITSLHKVPLRGMTRQFPGIMGFAWSSSFSMSIRSSSMELDVLIVGALADTRSAGLYFVAKQIAKMVQQACGQVQAVLYPDVARLWAQRRFLSFRRAIVQVQLVLDIFAVLAIAALYVCGRRLIEIGVGPAFNDAYQLVLVQMVALAFIMHAAPLRSALLAMGEQRAILHIVIWSTLLFQAIAFALVPLVGAVGANVAHLVLGATSAVAMERRARQSFKTAISGNSPRPASD